MSIQSLDQLKKELGTLGISEGEKRFVFRALIAEILQISFSEASFVKDDQVDTLGLDQLTRLLSLLKKGLPLQYVLGYTEFYNLRINCTSEALIPRPETEELVHWILTDFHLKPKAKILDLCTGTGCIALALKKHWELASVQGLDISKGALELAKQNAENLSVPVTFFPFDLLTESLLPANDYDVWVSNPPYIPESDRLKMEKNVLDHEPGLALFVPNHEACVFYERIAELGQRCLKRNGHLYVEIHEELATEVLAIFSKFGFQELEVRKDAQGKDRMIKAIKV